MPFAVYTRWFTKVSSWSEAEEEFTESRVSHELINKKKDVRCCQHQSSQEESAGTRCLRSPDPNYFSAIPIPGLRS